jgi:hypothetical protein
MKTKVRFVLICFLLSFTVIMGPSAALASDPGSSFRARAVMSGSSVATLYINPFSIGLGAGFRL